MIKKFKEKEIYNGKIVTMKLVDFEENGKKYTREIVEHKDAVAVFAIDDDGFVYCVKQYRFPLEREVLEIPAGLVESGESYEESALRELQEEIGMSAKKISKIFEGYNSVGFCNEKTVIFRATELFSSRLPKDEGENLFVEKIHVDELKKKFKNGEIENFKTAIAILNEI